MQDFQQHYHHKTAPIASRGMSGMASIIVTLVTMLVISLIVLGFASVSRREQRETLDQALSAQAFYAAESGVEDARTVIQDALKNGRPLVGKDQCLTNNSGGTYATGVSTVLDGENSVAYTCLKVNVSPEATKYDGVGDNYIVVPVKTAQPAERIEISWQSAASSPGTPASCPATTANVFSPQDQWACGYGVLRADVVATGGSLTHDGLKGNTLTGFFVPTRNGASGQLSYDNDKGKPNVTAANCDTTAYTVCKAVITDLGADTDFTLRVSSVYRTSNVKVVAYQGATPLTIDGAQAVIDATGKAQDVLRRIQVRLPISIGSNGSAPGYAMQSNSAICKRFQVSTTYFNIPGDIVDKDVTNPLCVQKSDGIPPPKACTQNSDIALALDTSSSTANKWQTDKVINNLRNDANTFALNTNIAAAANHASLITYSTNSKVLYPLGGSALAMAASTFSLAPDAGTNYLNGLNQIAGELTSARARAGSPKVAIFVTDGAPDDDKTAIRDKAAELKAAGYAIYTIGIDGTNYQSPIPTFDEQLLIDMAGNGGRYAVANTEADLQNILQTISNDLRCQ